MPNYNDFFNIRNYQWTTTTVSSTNYYSKPPAPPPLPLIIESIETRFDIKNLLWTTHVKPLLDNFAIVAGGAARQAFLNKDFGSTDIDLYFTNGTPKAYCQKHLINISRGYGKKYAKYNRTQQFKDNYADTYKVQDYIFQIINRKLYANIDEIFKTYDFGCCCFAIVKENNQYVIKYTQQALDDTTNKKLKVNTYRTARDIIQPYRVLKYALKKGFEPDDKVCEDMLDQQLRFFIRDVPNWMSSEQQIANFFGEAIPASTSNWNLGRDFENQFQGLQQAAQELNGLHNAQQGINVRPIDWGRPIGFDGLAGVEVPNLDPDLNNR